MALGTLAIVSSVVGGGIFVDRCTLVGDGSYPTGGSTGLLAKLRTLHKSNGLSILSVKPEGDNGDRLPEYDHANAKLKVRVISTAAEVANATDLSGVTFGLVITSK
jgi:hypothetical protein